MSQSEILNRYLSAKNAGNPDGVAACFTDDASVHDERNTHEGRAAIRAWSADAIKRYRLQSTLVELAAKDNILTAQIRVLGDFAGSPATLEHQFTLQDDLIRRLEIS